MRIRQIDRSQSDHPRSGSLGSLDKQEQTLFYRDYRFFTGEVLYAASPLWYKLLQTTTAILTYLQPVSKLLYIYLKDKMSRVVTTETKSREKLCEPPTRTVWGWGGYDATSITERALMITTCARKTINQLVYKHQTNDWILYTNSQARSEAG